jgi:hypothetical protein
VITPPTSDPRSPLPQPDQPPVQSRVRLLLCRISARIGSARPRSRFARASGPLSPMRGYEGGLKKNNAVVRHLVGHGLGQLTERHAVVIRDLLAKSRDRHPSRLTMGHAVRRSRSRVSSDQHEEGSEALKARSRQMEDRSRVDYARHAYAHLPVCPMAYVLLYRISRRQTIGLPPDAAAAQHASSGG